ncbi:MAG: primosomal protein N' [Thermoguttaceae bacterium]|nr:primosomal protein N' [Thermoguttaceae bacterium]
MASSSLFGEFQPWEEDDSAQRDWVRVATVIFPEAPLGEFDYLIPEMMVSGLRAGMRVRVPLGARRQLTTAYCVCVAERKRPERKLKEVGELLDAEPLLSEAMLRVTEWMAEHYLCGWGAVLEAIVPAGVRHQAGTREVTKLHLAESAPLDEQTRRDGAKIPRKLTSLQQSVLDFLRTASQPPTLAQLIERLGCSEGVVRTLIQRKWITPFRERVASGKWLMPKTPQAAPHLLNEDQRRALDAILESLNSAARIAPMAIDPVENRTAKLSLSDQNDERSDLPSAPSESVLSKLAPLSKLAIPATSPVAQVKPRMPMPILIHGVTGSGKTEVYIRAIEEVVRRGQQAIVLVPEISLTPQTVGRFRSRFDQVAVLHSRLSDVERHREWRRIAAGEVQVVVGARSAIFAPTPNPGMIIIDEEHESSFKQETVPRYHARDVAIRRATEEGITLVLGSATPSLESWFFAKQKKFRLVSMPRRVAGRPMPIVQTIDLREALPGSGPRGAISRPLLNAMRETLRDDTAQMIIMLNRRGFSTHIQCPSCGYVVNCPHCDIALTHHRERQTAICHYCDYEIPAPECCPECGYKGIRYSGFGTERLESEIRHCFPDVETVRMDTDTMHAPGAHEKALSAFRAGKTRILLGTQMIAKGLDFPNVTLVGVINADTALHLPDFRAAERTFHLVTQVAGRTGRGERGGRVLVQSFSPEHDAIQAAIHHDYDTFASKELPLRQMFGYPPFARMLRIVVRGPVSETVEAFAGQLRERLELELIGSVTFENANENAMTKYRERILGPAPAPFPKLRGYYRFQIQLTGINGRRLRDAVRAIQQRLESPEDIQWIADMDPIDML